MIDIRVICLGLVEARVLKTAVRCPSVEERTLTECRVRKITVAANEIGEVAVFKESAFHIQLIDGDILHFTVSEYRAGKISETQIRGIEFAAFKERVPEDGIVELASTEIHTTESLAGKVSLLTAGNIV